LALALAAVPALGLASAVAAQDARAARAARESDAVVAVSQDGLKPIVSSSFWMRRGESSLELEFEDGTRAVFAVREGRAWLGDKDIGEVPVGGPIDRSWRELLTRASDAPAEQLGRVLASWQPPEETELDRQLEAALGGSLDPALAIAEAITVAPIEQQIEIELSDSIERLTERLEELHVEVAEMEGHEFPIAIRLREARGGNWFTRGPLRHVFAGIGGLFKSAILYGVLFAISFVAIFFGGRRYIEGVADTARAATGRSLLVGLAASFLVIPVFILGILALAISIVGIPALLAWVPLFPVAVGLALVLGYIAVAHGAGEALAERRFYLSDWFQRGNSYYFLISGFGLLLAPFIVMNVVRMAGPWLGFLYGICVAVGVIGTWAALSIGLGAVLISRAGTRPLRPLSSPEPEIYAEPTSA
jgi:hypothetical protein